MVLTESESSKREKNANQTPNKMDKKDKPATKVVIRRLPPSMTQEEFLNQVSPIPNYNYIYTIKGDNSLGGNAFARVYVNFTNPEDIYIFKEKFDNYVFIDGNGHEYAAVVEYAAFQKIPKRRKPRPDLKAATIESDPAYIAFLESLNEQPNQEEKPEYNLNLTSNENKSDMTTPLLDYLKQRKVDRMRMREEKREERRKKEQEKKKLKEEDRKKRIEEKKQKSIAQKEAKKERENEKENKSNVEELHFKDTPEEEADGKPQGTSVSEAKKERTDYKAQKSFKNRNKFEDKDKKPKNKFKYEDRKEQRNRRDEFRERDREYQHDITNRQGSTTFERKPEQQQQKKVKKYSERREERKIVEASKEAKKAESTKKDQDPNNPIDSETKSETDKPPAPHKNPEKFKKHDKDTPREPKSKDSEDGEGSGRKRERESDTRSQRRIRNKDRPAMQIYKPGMLRKKSVDNDKDQVVIDEEKREIKEAKEEKEAEVKVKPVVAEE